MKNLKPQKGRKEEEESVASCNLLEVHIVVKGPPSRPGKLRETRTPSLTCRTTLSNDPPREDLQEVSTGKMQNGKQPALDPLLLRQ